MAKKKKTMVQQAFGLAAPVLPAPVAKVAGTRWGSRLLILLLPFLFATGVLTLSWNNGIPTVNFDRARALFVGQQVGERVQQQAARVAQDVRERQATIGTQSVKEQPASTQSQWGQAQPTSWQGQPAYQQPSQPQRQQSFQQPAYQQPAYQPQPTAPQWAPPAYR